MFKATQAKEIIIRTANEPGLLNRVSKIVSEKGINIQAISCWVYDIMAVIRIVTDDNLRAREALVAARFDTREEDVVQVLVPHKAGMLNQMTNRLAKANIDLEHLYATTPQTDNQCLVVFRCSNNEKALVEINKPF